jgi:tetratricopeptide (TPR) repeat protein
MDSLAAVIAWYRKSQGDDHPGTLTLLNNAGRAAIDAGDIERARTYDAELVERRTRVLGSEHPNTCMAMMLLGSDLILLGHKDEAASLIEPAVDTILRTQGPDSWTGLLALVRRGSLWNAQGRARESRTLMNELLAKAEKVWADAPLQRASALHVRGQACLILGDTDAAESDVRASLTLLEAAGPEHPRLERLYATMGQIREVQGRSREAEEFFARAGVWRRLCAFAAPK